MSTLSAALQSPDKNIGIVSHVQHGDMTFVSYLYEQWSILGIINH